MRVLPLLMVLGLAASGCGSSSGGAGNEENAAVDSGGAGSSGGTDSSSPAANPDGDAGANATPGIDASTPADGAAAGSAEAGVAGDAGTLWLPGSSTPIHFHWQLSDDFRAPADVIAGSGPIVYDIDGENSNAATVAAIHALGSNVKVVCYVDVGTYEPDRSDAAQFPAAVIGAGVDGWPGEKWLDVRAQATLLPIMKARLASWCQSKGFDGVEPDNLDGWTNAPGFPMTEADNVSYDLAIASAAHALGLSVGVKNLLPSLSSANLPAVDSAFDWALSEQCFEYNECGVYQQGFAAKGKAAWDVEYNVTPGCAAAATAHQNAQKRDLDLVAPPTSGYLYQPCIPDTQSTW